MQIGVVTFYGVANYGAMLQAYAMRRCLEGRGHSVIFVTLPLLINHRQSLWRCLVSKNIRNLRVKLSAYNKDEMTRFAKSYPHTGICHTVAEVESATRNCEAFVVGSDQIWNPAWFSGDYLPMVMLDFVDKNKLRISYAASFGTTKWLEEQNRKEAGRMLRKFNAISVRELSGVDMVKSLTGRDDAKWVLDPTMIQTVEFYNKLIGPQKAKTDTDYIFYFYIDHEKKPDVAKGVLKRVQKCLAIKNVLTDEYEHSWRNGFLYWLLGIKGQIAVIEWLSRIKNAKFILTNSFHGTVFAILFHRPFVSLLLSGGMSGMNERLISLLSALGLLKHAAYCDDADSVDRALSEDIDWNDVDYRLERLRKESINFLDVSGL